MAQRIAVLDLGTNTFHLLIAEVETGKPPEVIYATQQHPKLGEGGIAEGFITELAFQRGLNTLLEFSKQINQYGVEKIRAVATAAVRQANNGAEFIQKAKEQTGIEIELIDGNREADLIYRGVKHAVRMNETSLIMDIGGGSVEFILCDQHAVLWQKSYPIGAARLMAQFHHTDPISPIEIENIHQFLDEQLNELKVVSGQYQPQTLIGSAGAFETFAAFMVNFGYTPKTALKHPEFTFDIAGFEQVAQYLLQSRHVERAANPDILPVRVDMIVVATVLARYILKKLRMSEMLLSAYSLKEGLLFDCPIVDEKFTD